MGKYTLEDIEKVYKQCGVDSQKIKQSDVKFTQIPNFLMSDQNLKCNISNPIINKKQLKENNIIFL